MTKNRPSDPSHATRRSLLVGAAAGVTSSAVLQGLAPQQAAASTGQGITDWVNVVSGYGADSTGVKDSTAAIQNALNAVATDGGVVYFPVGQYKVSASLTYDSVYPLVVLGDMSAGQVGIGTKGTCIHSALTTGHVFDIRNCQMFYLHDLDICQDATVTFSAGNDFVGIYCDAVNEARVERCQINTGAGNYSFNTAIEFYNGTFSIARDCAVNGEVQAVWFTATSQSGAGCSLYDMQLTSTAGNGYGGIRVDGVAATLNISNCYTYRGDWGLTTGTATGNHPNFIQINNLQINNPRAGGVYLGSGSQFWGNQVWVSMAATPNTYTTEGIYISSAFGGLFYLANSTVQGPSNNGIYIGGGSGFALANCSIGGYGWGENNTYYGVHLNGSAVRITSLNNLHIDVDTYNGETGNSNKPRAAIGIESGVFHTTITGCISLTGSSYASGSSLIDSSGSTTLAANWNI